MLNIKDNGFGYFKTYKSILEYDNHKYKEDRLISSEKSSKNVRLVDNIKKFEKDIKKYKQDLFESYKLERHKNLKKSHAEINEIFQKSKIMRSFRVAINHIEIDTLSKLNATDEEKRQNTINFYQDVLNCFSKMLNENNKFNKKVDIVQADIHFDQSAPHLHIHVSNLYEKTMKKMKRDDVMSCNIDNSDLIRKLNDIIKNKQQSDNNINLTVNEVFANQLKIDNFSKQYHFVNRVDLKQKWPNIYNLYNWQKHFQLDDLKKSWRVEKELYFKMCKENLSKWNFSINEQNDIDNVKKVDEISRYFFYQTINYDYQKYNQTLANDQKITFEQYFRSNKATIAFNNDIAISPTNLNFMSHKLEPNLYKKIPSLEKIEKELINNLNLFKLNEMTKVNTKPYEILKNPSNDLKNSFDFDLSNKLTNDNNYEVDNKLNFSDEDNNEYDNDFEQSFNFNHKKHNKKYINVQDTCFDKKTKNVNDIKKEQEQELFSNYLER